MGHFKKQDAFSPRTSFRVIFAGMAGGLVLAGCSDGNRDENKACAAMTDRATLEEIASGGVAADFELIRTMPLTGAPIYELMTDSSREPVNVCVGELEEGIGGTYFENTLELRKTSGTTASVHESFHAAQDRNLNGINLYGGYLNPVDAVTADLLGEATAVSYELIVEQEAENNGLYYRLPMRETGYASEQSELRSTFNHFYHGHMRNVCADIQDPIRQDCTQDALELAGQQVTRSLMRGDNQRWLNGYTASAVRRAGLASSEYVSGCEANYRNTRADIFTRIGHVSDQINLTPPEFTDSRAGEEIVSFARRNFEISWNGCIAY